MVAILKHRDVARTRNERFLGVLLRAIARTTAESRDHAPARYGSDPSEEILLDADFDGERYVLIRIPRARHPHPSLSPRQWEIARLVAQGHPNKRIAALLDLSVWTVGAHVRRIFAKLGVNSRVAMVTRLLEAGEPTVGGGPAVRPALPQAPPRALIPAMRTGAAAAIVPISPKR